MSVGVSCQAYVVDARARAVRACAAVSVVLAAGFLAGCGGSKAPAPAPSLTLAHLALFPAQRSAPVGESFILMVTARDAAGADVPGVSPDFTSSNPAVVRIEPDKRLLATGVGTATVRASAGGQTAEAVIHVSPATYDLAGLGPPRILTADYIDLSKIERISRFRSTVGHSFTTGLEACRSMKHYFQPKPSLDWTSVDIFAPASGTIAVTAADGAAGSRVTLRPRELAVLDVTIFHVALDPGIVPGTWVEAGQHIGRHASSSTMSDIAVGTGPKEGGTLASYFQAMTDSVFAAYQARGVPSREAAIITKEERDADPVPCVGESQFTVRGTLPDWLNLN